jgi:hypothetical protein
MTTTTLHSEVQRSRFAQHALAALSGLTASLFGAPLRAEPASNAAESAAREAQRVREMAYAYSKTDPGFAADLYAAASRHEGQYED